MRNAGRRIVRGVSRLMTVRIETTLLYSHDLQSIPLATDDASELVIRQLAASEVDLLREFEHLDLDEAHQRLVRGDICVVCFADGRLAHFSWIQRCGRHPITAVSQTCEVVSDQIWIYHCHTAEWARGRRIYPSVLGYILSSHREKTCAPAWIYTTLQNVSSQRGIERIGFRLRGHLRAFRLGPVIVSLPPRLSSFEGLKV
jgi:hypothetical protein